jgi:hypothetical protein
VGAGVLALEAPVVEVVDVARVVVVDAGAAVVVVVVVMAAGVVVVVVVVMASGVVVVVVVVMAAGVVVVEAAAVAVVVVVVVVTTELEDARMKSFLSYKANLLPAPQYSLRLPVHKKLGFWQSSWLAAWLEALFKTFPHQHSRPYSTPAHWYCLQALRQISTLTLVPETTRLGRARPVAGSAQQAMYVKLP